MRSAVLALAAAVLCGCAALLPHTETETQSPWASFEEAQKALDKVIARETTLADLARIGLDPKLDPNIAILNYSDILRRFVPGPSIDAASLDSGVKECIAAHAACIAYEIDRKVVKRRRYGNFLSDFLNFRRKTDVVGWRFTAVLLIKDGVVIYKLTGGQPKIREHEETTNPLGPLQGRGAELFGL